MKNWLNTEELEVTLGQHIKHLRLLKNMTREILAGQAGMSVSALKNLETGTGASIKTLVRVLRVLGKTEWITTLAPVATIDPLRMLKTKEPRQRARQPKMKLP